MTNPERRILLTPAYAIGKKTEIVYDMGRNDGLKKAIDIINDIRKHDTGLSDLEHGLILNLTMAIKTRGAYGKPIYNYGESENNASQEQT